MKVRELIAKLQAFEPDLDVLCYCEDEGIAPSGKGFKLFDIDEITRNDAEAMRLDDNTPYLKLGRTAASSPHVFICLTGDF